MEYMWDWIVVAAKSKTVHLSLMAFLVAHLSKRSEYSANDLEQIGENFPHVFLSKRSPLEK